MAAINPLVETSKTCKRMTPRTLNDLIDVAPQQPYSLPEVEEGLYQLEKKKKIVSGLC